VEAAKNTRSAAAPSPLALPFFSAVLAAVSFPRFELYWLAWLAWVPLLLGIRRARNAMGAFGVSYFAGFLFLLFSVYWLKEVTLFGLLFVCAYQAFYFAAFGAAVKGILTGSRGSVFPALAAIPAAWVVSEWARSEVPIMGFGWNLLAYSQAGNLLAIQSANLIGAYGVSWLVMLANTAVFLALSSRQAKPRFWAVGLGFVPFVLNIYYGGMVLRKTHAGPVHRVAVVQGNIPQENKWEPELKELILEKYLKLTELAAFDGPELVLWPEAAYPGFFNEEAFASAVPALAGRLGIPILLGSPHREPDGRYFNSAYLVGPDGKIRNRYDKMRLVPFGEYVPFKPVLSFLEPYAYALGVGDFQAGKRFTVFQWPGSSREGDSRFAVLICFEDIFPGLAREFALEGARCLVVITNDAWFGKSAAPYQHLQASVFRAIENGMPVVRAANTGVSAFVSRWGEVEDRVKNEKGYDIFISGALTRPVAFEQAPTFYRKWGFRFPWVCAAVLAAAGFRLCLIFPGSSRDIVEK
jgi:apolipoprotein N-acyltransferase